MNVRSQFPKAFDSQGRLKPFTEQLGEYILQKASTPNRRWDAPFVFTECGEIPGIEKLSGKPIVMTVRSYRHIAKKHRAQASLLMRLVEEMSEYVLAFEHADNTNRITLILGLTSEHGHDLIAVLEADNNIGRIDVTRIVTCHGKSLSRLYSDIDAAIEADTKLYFTDKTGTWLDVQRYMAYKLSTTEKVHKRLQEKYITSWSASNHTR